MNKIKKNLLRMLVVLLGFAIIHVVQGATAHATDQLGPITEAVDNEVSVQHEVQPVALFGRLVGAEYPYGCSASYNYGGIVGNSECDGGLGKHRVRLSCRDLTNNVVYYVYGVWKPAGYAYYNISWAYCTSLGKPSYAYDAIGAVVQTRSW